MARVTRLFLEQKKRGLRLQDTAAKTGVPVSALSELQRGLRKPYPVWAMKLCRFFDLPEDELFAEVTNSVAK